MTIAGKISLGGSVGLSLATAALAFLVMSTKGQFASQLRAVEDNLRGGKFSSLGLPYTGNFTENTAEPAETVAKAGAAWEITSNDLKSTQAAIGKTKEELSKAQADNQELTLTSDKLTKDLTATKSDLESTNSKLTLTSEKLQAYADGLKGKKPEELFSEISTLEEKIKVTDSENKMLASAKEKTEQELKKIRDQVEMTKPGSSKSITLTGKIVAVNPTWNFVIVDLGKNDQLVESLSMVVYRGEKMIGKVKVVTVDATTSVADILPGTPASAIEVGDTVVY